MKKYAVTEQSPPWSQNHYFTRTQRSMTYDAVKSGGDEGLTSPEIVTRSGVTLQRVRFYLSELRRAGLIKRLGDAIDPSTLSEQDAIAHAIAMLENAFVIKATRLKKENGGKTPEALSVQFARYNKVKALYLRGTTTGEVNAAMRQTLLDLVKMVL